MCLRAKVPWIGLKAPRGDIRAGLTSETLWEHILTAGRLASVIPTSDINGSLLLRISPGH